MLEQLITQIVQETVQKMIEELSLTRQETSDDTMNTKQTAGYLNMSIPRVYQNLSILPHCKIGKKLIFNKNDMKQFLEQKKEKDSNKAQNKATLNVKGSKRKVI